MGKRNPNKMISGGKSSSPMLDFITDKEMLRERYESLPYGDKSKYLAYASAVWGIRQTASRLGISHERVIQARRMFSHMLQELNYVAMETVAKIYLSKALEIAETIDVNNISDDRKPAAVKCLMDACDIARLQCIKTNAEDDADETVEMFYRIRRRLRKDRDDGDSGGDNEDERKTIDVTSEVEEVKVDA